jgi:hypothetical protein
MTMTMTIDELARRFTDTTLPRAQWTHVAHLRVGLWHVHRFGPAEALRRLRDGIRRLNLAHGTPNTATSGYHETITAAYVTLIAQFLAAHEAALPAPPSFERQVAELLAGPLADPKLLRRFWSTETLMSPAARAGWVAPDRAPLALPTPTLPVR